MDEGRVNSRQEHAFVVRVWREEGGLPSSWRGSVEHVGTRHRRYFGDLAEVLHFIRQHAAARTAQKDQQV